MKKRFEEEKSKSSQSKRKKKLEERTEEDGSQIPFLNLRLFKRIG